MINLQQYSQRRILRMIRRGILRIEQYWFGTDVRIVSKHHHARKLRAIGG